MTLRSKIIWISVFGIAFGFVEASVVVYLRSIYYPEGFMLPIKPMSEAHLIVELAREAATIFMLTAVGVLSGTRCWERFGYFIVAFGVWDIFYYVWLKVLLNWPSGLFDWDILFLIPVPWIGPVVAPVLLSILMIIYGYLIIDRIGKGKTFKPNSLSWSLALSAAALILYSFVQNIGATLHAAVPPAYGYELLIAGLTLSVASFIVACRNPLVSGNESI